MSRVFDRRTLLRRLASLPLIGGLAAMSCNSATAATSIVPAPVSTETLRRYVAFISREHYAALRELAERETPHRFAEGERPWRAPMYWTPDIGLDSQIALESADPSTRAVAVLTAAGIGLPHGAQA